MALHFRFTTGIPMAIEWSFRWTVVRYEEANTYMHSDAFAANPAGVEIDPENLLAQYRSGVPEHQLLTMPEGPMSPIPREHGMS